MSAASERDFHAERLAGNRTGFLWLQAFTSVMRFSSSLLLYDLRYFSPLLITGIPLPRETIMVA